MTTEVGVPGKSIQYLNLHREGTKQDSFCSVDEQWSGPLVTKQSDYLVAISRFEVPMNRMPITREIKNAVEIFRYFDADFKTEVDGSAHAASQGLTLPAGIPYQKKFNMLTDDIDEKEPLAEPNVHNQVANPLFPGALGHHNPEKMIAHNKNPGGNHTNNGSPTDDVSAEEMENYLSNAEQLKALNLTADHPIDMPRCHTIFEFMQLLSSKINDRLLYVDPDGASNANYKTITAFGDSMGDVVAKTDKGRYNTFGNGNIATEFDENSSDPIAYFQIKMDSDYRFSVTMNHYFSGNYYIKLHPEVFNMFQFEEMNSLDMTEDDFADFDGMRKPIYKRKYLMGRRFMGDRMCGASKGADPARYANWKLISKNRNAGYHAVHREIIMLQQLSSSAGIRRSIGTNELFIEDQVVTFTAPVSAADSINRIKSLVFQSSLPTKSEGASGSAYQHFLTDYTIPTRTNFSWSPSSYVTGQVNEEAASEVSFTNSNPSSGRLLILTDPSPLYELKLEVLAKCWNYEKESFYFERIPLPPGSTFTCKIVFISKNQIYEDHSQRPELIHP